jgi:hypothetical protein
MTDGSRNVVVNSTASQVLTCVGGNGTIAGVTWQGVTINGGTAGANVGIDTTCAYITFAGWHFANLSVGFQPDNRGSGTFTEGNVCSHCWFEATVTTAMKYVVGSGTNSFKRTGLEESYVNQGSGPVVIVGAGALPYQAPLSVVVWGPGAAATFLRNDSLQHAPNFVGSLLFEDRGYPRTLGDTSANPFYFTGPVNEFGSANGPPSIHRGTMIKSGDFTIVAGSSAIQYQPEDYSDVIPATVGASANIDIALPSSSPTQATVNRATVTVEVFRSGYDFKCSYDVVYDAVGTGIAIINACATPYVFNAAGYGRVTVSTPGGTTLRLANNWAAGAYGSYSVHWEGTPVVK